MNKFITSIILVFVLFSTQLQAQNKMWVTAYYDVWQMLPLGANWYSEPPERINYNSGITHIILFPNGNIRTGIAPYFGPVGGVNASDSLDVLSGVGRANFTYYADSLIAKAHRAGVRVLLCVNAVSPAALTAVIDPSGPGVVDGTDSAQTDVLTRGIAGFLFRHKFDGVDINIEHGGSPYPSRAHIAMLIRRMRAALNLYNAGIGGRMTFTLSPTSGDEGNYDAATCNANVDQINPQTYDNQYAWNGCINANVNWYASNVYRPSDAQLGSYAGCFGGGNLAHSISEHGPNRWAAAGFNKSILGAGVSSYGRLRRPGKTPFDAFTNDGYAANTPALITALLANGGTLAPYDTVTKSQWISGTAINNATYNGSNASVVAGQGFYFTYPTPQSLQDVVKYLKDNSYSGIMMFDYQMDCDPANVDITKRNWMIEAAAAAVGGAILPPPTVTATVTASATKDTVGDQMSFTVSTSTPVDSVQWYRSSTGTPGVYVLSATVTPHTLFWTPKFSGSWTSYAVAYKAGTPTTSNNVTVQVYDSLIVVPPIPCDTLTAYQNGYAAGRASITCPVCPPYPDTVTMKTASYNAGFTAGAASVTCPPYPDTSAMKANAYNLGYNFGFSVGVASVICPPAVHDTVYITNTVTIHDTIKIQAPCGINMNANFIYFSGNYTDVDITNMLKQGALIYYMGTKSGTKTSVRGYKPQ